MLFRKSDFYLVIFFLLAFSMMVFRGAMAENKLFLPFIFLCYMYFFRVEFNKVDYRLIVFFSVLNDVLMLLPVGFSFFSLFLVDRFVSNNRRFIMGHNMTIYLVGFFLSSCLFYFMMSFLMVVLADKNFSMISDLSEIFILSIYYLFFHLGIKKRIKCKMNQLN
jgi:hypothetical protein